MRTIAREPTYAIKAIRQWMALYHEEYEYSTSLAESCADALDIYEERLQYTIPEIVYAIALEILTRGLTIPWSRQGSR